MALILGLTSLAGVAHADTPVPDVLNGAEPDLEESPELEAYLETLSADERDEFINTQLPASSEMQISNLKQIDPSEVPAGVIAPGDDIGTMACWTARMSWTQRANAGNRLYSFYHVGGWCEGASVTSAWVADFGGDTHTAGWRYVGALRSGSGVVSGQGRSYSQHRFVLGAGGIDIQERSPCGRVKGHASSSYSYDNTCGIY